MPTDYGERTNGYNTSLYKQKKPPASQLGGSKKQTTFFKTNLLNTSTEDCKNFSSLWEKRNLRGIALLSQESY